MTSNDNISAKDKIAAKIALDVTKGDMQNLGSLPTDVELAELYDGKLDAVRKNQVLGHIAEDSSLYKRWIELVESIQYQHESTVHERESTKTSWLAGVKDFIESFNAKQWGGLGVAFASIVAVAFVSVVQLNSLNYLDASSELYAEFGGQWEYIPESSSLPTRNIGGQLEPELRVDQGQYLVEGIRQGLEKLGEDFDIEGMGVSQNEALNSANVPQQQADALVALGEFAAISYFKCQQQSPIAFYESANILLDGSIQYLIKTGDENITAFTDKLSSYQFAKNNVCASVKPILNEARAAIGGSTVK